LLAAAAAAAAAVCCFWQVTHLVVSLQAMHAMPDPTPLSDVTIALLRAPHQHEATM